MIDTPHRFVPRRNPDHRGCVRCGRVKDNPVHVSRPRRTRIRWARMMKRQWKVW